MKVKYSIKASPNHKNHHYHINHHYVDREAHVTLIIHPIGLLRPALDNHDKK